MSMMSLPMCSGDLRGYAEFFEQNEHERVVINIFHWLSDYFTRYCISGSPPSRMLPCSNNGYVVNQSISTPGFLLPPGFNTFICQCCRGAFEKHPGANTLSALSHTEDLLSATAYGSPLRLASSNPRCFCKLLRASSNSHSAFVRSSK